MDWNSERFFFQSRSRFIYLHVVYMTQKKHSSYCKGTTITFLFVSEMVFKVNVHKVFVITSLFTNAFDSSISNVSGLEWRSNQSFNLCRILINHCNNLLEEIMKFKVNHQRSRSYRDHCKNKREGGFLCTVWLQQI